MFYLIGVGKAQLAWIRQSSLQIAITIAAVSRASVMVPKPTVASQEHSVEVLT